MLTDVAGVLDAEQRLIAEMTVAEVQAGIASGMISGGMIPKVETCIHAVRNGTRGAVILDGRVPHACLLELFTEMCIRDSGCIMAGRVSAPGHIFHALRAWAPKSGPSPRKRGRGVRRANQPEPGARRR